MIYTLVNKDNKQELNSILNILQTTIAPQNQSQIADNFKQSIPKNNEYCYALCQINKNPISIYSIHKQLKLTRELSTIYHLQSIYTNGLNRNDKWNFQKWIVQNIGEAYKIVCLNSEEGYFEKYQKLMKHDCQQNQ